MKQNTLKWLSCSLILLVALSCKKKKGALDDFDSGRFDFVCIWNHNGVQDTVTGEVSGPYSQSEYYYFNVKQELGAISSLKEFQVGYYPRMVNEPFSAHALYISAKITSEEHDAEHLWVSFQNENPSVGELVTGTFTLTRKE
ncbi:hypothetical protein [Fluviicola taffensis]|uniref:hypothetical protein n=1 Tax=Fluviicola taffensis TaxID=191579 RepID=UPI0031384034